MLNKLKIKQKNDKNQITLIKNLILFLKLSENEKNYF